MMNEQANTQGLIQVPSIRLSWVAEQFVVMPRIGDAAPFDPFPLPLLPMSRLNSMVILMDSFYRIHGRCMAILLLFDPRAQTWFVRIPKQCCYGDAVRWDLVVQEDQPGDVPGHLVVTIQSLVAREGEALTEHVPPIDGLHLMYDMAPPDHCLHYFARTENVVQAVPPETLQGDDWQALLQINRELMQVME